MIPFPGLTECLSPPWRKSSVLLRRNPQLELSTSLILKRHLACFFFVYSWNRQIWDYICSWPLCWYRTWSLFWQLMWNPCYGALLSTESLKIKESFHIPAWNLFPTLWESCVNIKPFYFTFYCTMYRFIIIKKKKYSVSSCKAHQKLLLNPGSS